MKMMRAVLWAQGSGLLIAALTGCGSDSSGGNSSQAVAEFKTTCIKLCQKEAMCQPAIASEESQCESICNSAGQGGSGGSTGTTTTVSCNYNDVISKENACISGTCDALDSCLQAAYSECSVGSTGGATGVGGSSSGAGGTSSGAGGASSGAGGTSSGAGGTTASGDCSVCDKAGTCCAPLYTKLGQATTACSTFSAATCQSYPATEQSAFIDGCTGILTAGKAEGIAECM